MKENTQNDQEKTNKNSAIREKKQKGSWFWIFLICFSSAWMFAAGVLVGRGTAPVQFDIEKIQKEISSLREIVIKREEERKKAHAEDIEQKTQLGFYTELKKTGETKTQTKADKEEVQEGAEAVLAAQSMKGNEASKQSIAATEPTKAEPLPGSEAEKTEATEPEFPLLIQVSSLKGSAAADNLVQSLRKKGFPAFILKSDVAGKGLWYRVRIGPYKDKTEAEKILARLKKQNFNAIFVSP
jgi:cell division septation protein DedD